MEVEDANENYYDINKSTLRRAAAMLKPGMDKVCARYTNPWPSELCKISAFVPLLNQFITCLLDKKPFESAMYQVPTDTAHKVSAL